MAYQIKYYYKTGDSFSTRDEEGVLEMEWKDIENAKIALTRIEEHYKWYEWHNRFFKYKEEPPEPEWHKGLQYDFSVKVALDNGKEVQFTAPWCGYFETLYGAEIIMTQKGTRFGNI